MTTCDRIQLDATFPRFRQGLYYQLLMIMAWWEKDGIVYHSIPVISLMTKKTTNDYNIVLDFVNDKLKELGYGPMKCKLVITDREPALINSIHSRIKYQNMKRCLLRGATNLRVAFC